LRFSDSNAFIFDQGYHFEDTIRVHPLLLRYTLTPRLPLDPFTFIRAFPDEEPL
jgi:hypothetical protein